MNPLVDQMKNRILELEKEVEELKERNNNQAKMLLIYMRKEGWIETIGGCTPNDIKKME